MQVFIAGSTGVLGRRLVTEFGDRGHSVIGLTRDATGDEIVEARGGEPRRGDLFDEASILQAAEGADTIIHAATAIPTDSATPEAWELNNRVRTEGAEALTKAAVEVDADQYLQQSIVYVARQPDGSAYDESSAPNPVPWTQSALDAEEIAVEAGEQHGFDVSVLRCGNFYGVDSYYTRADGEGLIHGERPIIEGTQETLLSYLHADDAARAFVAAAEATQSGLWHVVDDEPMSDAEYVSILAERLDASAPGHISNEAAREAMGDITVELLTNAWPTSNDKFRREIGWEPTYPTCREGLTQVVNEWESEGFLPDSE
ncbi:NAD-dependent epimerase/dehydratase family protein [Haladaptatus halobius]|uniref:NAD-dependent epimerase/dehydratase family protein n=1 Tax=Haladaptatus halobius TaxID=2884875 RepID=UPI001D09F9E9|nr:NAD(P)-dependent oxidoreductase [Haladaptatus halobius]